MGISVSGPFPCNVSFAWDDLVQGDDSKRSGGSPAVAAACTIFSATWPACAWGGEEEEKHRSHARGCVEEDGFF